MDISIVDQFLQLWSDLKEEDEFYVKKPLLAHYSSIEVLEKISRTNELWLSNPLFMNDWEEGRFGINESYRQVLEDKQVSRACGDAQRYKVFRDAYSHYYSEFAGKHALDTYVLCLSEHDPGSQDGVLSMWRGYGGNGHGAAIVFDASKLNNLPSSVFILAKVRREYTRCRFLGGTGRLIGPHASLRHSPHDRQFCRFLPGKLRIAPTVVGIR